MYKYTNVISLLVLLVSLSSPLFGQVQDPIPDPIIKLGLNVEFREIARLTDTSEVHPPGQHRASFCLVIYSVVVYFCQTLLP
jgi:hypothetical protein